MKNLILTYKLSGETPLECLERIRLENGISKEIPMTYAGRLDPLAEGALLLLVGEQCKKKEEYLGLDKEYEVEILLGLQTDTHDQLGVITGVYLNHEGEIDFKKYACKFTQEYPAYSSKMIAMKETPIVSPTKEVEIYSIDLLEKLTRSGAVITEDSLRKIEKVSGDFRQEKIIESWNKFGKEYGEKVFKILKIRVKCSSGTYMRLLAHRVGGIATSIKRTKIGEFEI